MKKILISIFLVIPFLFVGADDVFAGNGQPAGIAPGGCCRYAPTAASQATDEDSARVRNDFLTATVELRKQMAMKQAELAAVMSHEKPDPKKAGKITGEIFDLRVQLKEKAAASGLNADCGGCQKVFPGKPGGPR